MVYYLQHVLGSRIRSSIGCFFNHWVARKVLRIWTNFNNNPGRRRSMIDSSNPHPASNAITTRCPTSPGGSRATSLQPGYKVKVMKIGVALFSSQHTSRCCNPAVTPTRVSWSNGPLFLTLTDDTRTSSPAPSKGNKTIMRYPDPLSVCKTWIRSKKQDGEHRHIPVFQREQTLNEVRGCLPQPFTRPSSIAED